MAYLSSEGGGGSNFGNFGNFAGTCTLVSFLQEYPSCEGWREGVSAAGMAHVYDAGINEMHVNHVGVLSTDRWGVLLDLLIRCDTCACSLRCNS